MNRIVEVYTGAYASGKSEISINRALMLHDKENPVTLVDLDTVEPAYTLRPLKKEIESYGIKVVTQESYFGLGETGNTITGEQMNCLSYSGDIVIDVGYGVGGLDILEVITGIDKEKNLNIYIVINTSKPETSKVKDIVEYIKWSAGTSGHSWKKFSGIISNAHYGDETTKQDAIKGFELIKEASKILNLPIFALTVSEKLHPEFDTDSWEGLPIWYLKRFMPNALW
jgi:tetrahydromethanopterin S-methyltransferase subunit F